ncbi:hypothetical protein [Sphingomonas sp.]|uniref:hypothetical protein n=1 Tax=Sphingomonas sp. TaxID=28214 RepID=UPI003D6D71C0
MTKAYRLLAIAAIFLLAAPGSAQTADGKTAPATDIRHAESGWIFPPSVEGFQRTSDAKVLAPQGDVAVDYERVDGGKRTIASVYVYPSTSSAADADFQGAEAAIVAGLKDQLLSQLWSEGPFRVGTARPLVGEKAFYKIGLGPQSWQTNLYYFETGKWRIKVRVTLQDNDFTVPDSFVRALPWQSLALDNTCSATACQVDRPLPVHAYIPEMLVSMLNSKLPDVFAAKVEPCDPNRLNADIVTPAKTKENGLADPIWVAAQCSPGDGLTVSAVRVVFPPQAITAIEKEAPDGLSLRQPLTYFALRDTKTDSLTEMHDGKLDAAAITAILQRLRNGTHRAFAAGKKGSKPPAPITRFVK